MKKILNLELDKTYNLVVQTILTSGKVTKFTWGKIKGEDYKEIKNTLTQKIVKSKNENKMVMLENKFGTDLKLCNLDGISEFEIFLEQIF